MFFLIVSGSMNRSQDDSAVTEQGKAGAQRKVQQVLSVYKIRIFSQDLILRFKIRKCELKCKIYGTYSMHLNYLAPAIEILRENSAR